VVDKALNGVKPLLMVTDPPYGVGFERGKFVGRGKAAKGLKFAPIANDDLRGAALAEAAGFKVQSQLVWRKTPFVIGRADYHWQHEICGTPSKDLTILGMEDAIREQCGIFPRLKKWMAVTRLKSPSSA
jgi:hypothetical protein